MRKLDVYFVVNTLFVLVCVAIIATIGYGIGQNQGQASAWYDYQHANPDPVTKTDPDDEHAKEVNKLFDKLMEERMHNNELSVRVATLLTQNAALKSANRRLEYYIAREQKVRLSDIPEKLTASEKQHAPLAPHEQEVAGK